MHVHRLCLTATLLFGSLQGFAAEPQKPSPKPELRLDLPSFGALPKGDGLVAPKSEPLTESAPKITSPHAEYTVVAVKHAKGFMRSPHGSTPLGGALQEIALTGDPSTTEKFTTVVRVRCKERLNAPIELAILDTRGDTVMSGSGELMFRGVKADEVDYTIDWEPTVWRGGGEFQVLVRISGQPKGSYPLKFTVR